MSIQRRILFLQGPTSLFWRELAISLEERGHKTFKIHVALGDQLWWFRRGGVAYRGRFSRWRGFLEAFVEQHGISDILFYADRQPYHVIAQDVAKARKINAIAIENGYLRPDWITMERAGMSAYSLFPDDPAAIRQRAENLPEPDLVPRYRHSFGWEITNEILHHGFNYLYRPLFPFFRSGRYYDLFAEYLIGLAHLPGKNRQNRRAEATVSALTSKRSPFFVVALQLQGDKQILDNSPFAHLSEMIDMVVLSFAKNAPRDTQLVFKQHPHDNGAENWSRRVHRAAAHCAIADRVKFVDGGSLDKMLAAAKGCTTVNSTVGLLAIRAGCPVKPLGIAIYDMPGLTHQGSLDSFWTLPEPIDALLARDFNKMLAATIQVKGSFYDPKGREAAIATMIERIEAGLPMLPGAAGVEPPRLVKARELGVRILENR
ncbi:capsule biosynthesis protein [Rhizobium sp. RAF56]|uniref:capsule biosynthesis protein n=1 Tax=Rhizobium sp. RAF56 TaxID=3233062 RepID=UPI003F9A05D4